MVHPALAALGPHSTLADLPLADWRVRPTTPGQEVADAFEHEQELAGIIVCEGDKLVGMISRQRFYREMQRPFSSEIYFRRRTALLLATLGAAPLTLSAT